MVLRIGPLLLAIALGGCSLKIEDARLSIRKDLSSSANVLISRPGPADAIAKDLDAEAKDWASMVQSCGGSYRQVFQVPRKIMVESQFEMEGERERDMLLLCMTEKAKHRPQVAISKQEGFFVDRYELQLSFTVPWSIDIVGEVDLLPDRLSLEMPGSIVDHTDSSYLPFNRASWQRKGRGGLVLDLQPIPAEEVREHMQELRRSLGPNPSLARAEAAADRLDSILRATIISEERRFTTLEIVTAAGAMAALVPLLPLLARQVRRYRRRPRPGAEVRTLP